VANLLDRAIDFVSPAAGLRRARLRAMSEIARLSYEGAKTGRRTLGWNTTNKSANAEIGPDLAKLRDRSRDLIRDNHYAAKAAMEFQAKVVGAGIMARMPEPAQSAWNQWARQCSADGLGHFAAVQSLIARALFESGEVLVRRRLRRGAAASGMKVPLQLQVLEPDFLDLSKTGTVTDGENASGYIIQGVEFNTWGQRVAYWLFSQHPGEVTTTIFSKSAFMSSRVEASEVLHIYDCQRPQQVRGVPHLAPVLLAMRDLADWEDAELVRKKTEACLAAFITSQEDSPLGLASTDSVTGLSVETFEPGMITRLKPGEAITVNQPTYAGGYADYKRSRVRDLASGIGIPFEILASDLSTVNYSSYRSGLLSFRDRIEHIQENILIPQLCWPVWEWFLSAANDFGGVGIPPVEVEWQAPAFDLLDREVEAKADTEMLANGTMSWPQAVSRQGYDPEKQIVEIETWHPRLIAAGVTFGKGAVQSADNPTQQPAA
jgi:lambda family phage portal protein